MPASIQAEGHLRTAAVSLVGSRNFAGSMMHSSHARQIQASRSSGSTELWLKLDFSARPHVMGIRPFWTETEA